MPRRATGESYSWDQAKETVFLEKLDYYVAYHSGRHPLISVLDGWAREFNAAFGGVPAYSLTLSQKKDRMKKINRGWKALQCRTGLGYDPVTYRVICLDDQWQSFIQVHKECNHLRYEGLGNKELYYNIFEKNHAVGASGYESVSMPDDSPATVDLDASLDNSGIGPVPEDDLTASSGTRRWTNRRRSVGAGPSRSRGSSGKRKQRDETDEMTFMAMQVIVTTVADQIQAQRAMMWHYLSSHPTLQRTFHQLPEIDRREIISIVVQSQPPSTS
ncbi:hypothetical protein TIFTF001_050486 [Ficus carica]|uniref:Myb/SANT-like domain-containing protein n=1 Tax=Ficus carica TaxID=3494 RepID=A0AA87Z8P8_FICCA|nr:hypothetical protein TIFTF001_050480 [Ficus carica]GMN27725.1 hypothetical protein TIFTF001_050482 [Ficus carica]GMN27740.1 hypothetical protein TIFTF001_050484 [Ficus carica]GMN27748.1 hypothetical protein TIFTF001_050486 [Ficus carica]